MCLFMVKIQSLLLMFENTSLPAVWNISSLKTPNFCTLSIFQCLKLQNLNTEFLKPFWKWEEVHLRGPTESVPPHLLIRDENEPRFRNPLSNFGICKHWTMNKVKNMVTYRRQNPIELNSHLGLPLTFILQLQGCLTGYVKHSPTRQVKLSGFIMLVSSPECGRKFKLIGSFKT
jgi:hypothetical protein